MTEELFRQDGYVSEFESIVVSIDKEWVELEGTFFYPGGGGQMYDTGSIGGVAVVETSYKGNNIMHKVPGHEFVVGDKVWCSVNWERRYDLMRGHTAEHLLFGRLKSIVPSLEIVKIFISPDSKYVIVNEEPSLEAIEEAVAECNKAIDDNLPVVKSIMSKNDPEASNVRAHLEKIDGDEFTVVEIGDIDIAACSGIHVMETEEIGSLFVDRVVSAGKDGYAVHFKIGDDAVNTSNMLASTCLKIIKETGSKPEDIVKTISNMKNEISTLKKQSKIAVSFILENQIPEKISGIDFYSMIIPSSDRQLITEYAEKRRQEGSVSVYVFGEDSSVILSSGIESIDCKKILSSVAQELGGRGGGKPGFAQGGFPGVPSEKVLSSLLNSIKNSENF